MVRKKLPVLWDDEAKKSLKSIYKYIIKRDSAEAAKRVRNEITNQTKTLNGFPEKYEREHNLEDKPGNYRYMIIWSYKVIYEVTPKAIHVLDVFHTSRNPSKIFKRK
ncbi:MAG: type II toxin-antitoxin system RelE/ParE family toxin [Cyclobacteriaceae bacterium]|nr:type II toxin-antitoxin system RelE/ParE family toxin [Cyclobacteriaceae bacterium]